MKKRNIIYSYWYLFVILIIVFLLFAYGYNSGSCKINKKYICSDNFCLFKEFKIYLPQVVKGEINKMLHNKDIQRRVNIETYPETIFNCALPNKRGVTISTQNVKINAPHLIHFYENDLCKLISNKININLFPTDLHLPTTCAILIYENEGDWINWHYDYNYYDGRFFTILIPITNNLTCTEFQFKNDNNEVKSVNLTNNNSICFEGNYLYHRASKLCENQKRIMLSCQYVTNNNISFLNKMRLNLKDFAYTGKIGG
jgi:hypothetical protein